MRKPSHMSSMPLVVNGPIGISFGIPGYRTTFGEPAARSIRTTQNSAPWRPG